MIYKDLQLTGATIVPPGTMQRIVRLIEQRSLLPVLAQTFALRDLAAAQEVFMGKKHVGNIVVTMTAE
jgi:NADPH:quinone reductase-like Zn-dependent oxidoreductase